MCDIKSSIIHAWQFVESCDNGGVLALRTNNNHHIWVHNDNPQRYLRLRIGVTECPETFTHIEALLSELGEEFVSNVVHIKVSTIDELLTKHGIKRPRTSWSNPEHSISSKKFRHLN